MKKTGLTIVASLAAVSAIAAVSSIITTKFLSLAIDRTPPKLYDQGKKAIAGSSSLGDIMLKIEEASKELEGKPTEEVHTVAFDGEELIGHYYKCANPKRLLIAFHGWRSSWSLDFGLIADFWHQNDCDVLFVEQRGQNSSSGNYMGFGLLERFDCPSWANWAIDNEITLPIYLIGLSLGATTVLMSTGLNLPSQVHGVIADCGFTSPHDIWKHVFENNLHIPYTGLRSLMVDDIVKKRLTTPSSKYSCEEALKNNKIPVQFFHGTDDHFVPVSMTYRNYKACASDKYLMVVPGADHGMSYLVEKENYEKACKNFWKKYDKKPSKQESIS